MAKYYLVLTTRETDYFIMQLDRNFKNGFLTFIELEVAEETEYRLTSKCYVEDILNSKGLNIIVTCLTDLTSYSNSGDNILYVETDAVDLSTDDYSLVSIKNEDFAYNDVFSAKTAEIVNIVKKYFTDIEED